MDVHTIVRIEHDDVRAPVQQEALTEDAARNNVDDPVVLVDDLDELVHRFHGLPLSRAPRVVER